MTRTIIISKKVLAGYANNKFGSYFMMWPFGIFIGLQEYGFRIVGFGHLSIIGPNAKPPLLKGGYYIGKWRILIGRP